jgi:uncharacterized protein with von Willebrand factor type A (vWA) domain
MTLFDRHEEFVTALRGAGLPVSIAENIDAAAALRAVDVLDREQLRAGYAATLVKRNADRAAFDTVFDLFYPATTDDTAAEPSDPDQLRRRDDPELQQFRDRLAQALLGGEERDLSQLAREGVGRFGAIAGRTSGSRSWSGYAAQTRISAQTLMARLLDAVLTDADIGGLVESTARTTFDTRISRFRRMIDSEVQRRLAQDAGAERIAETAVRPSIDRVDLLSATRDDLVAIRREIQPLARRLAARLAVEQRRGRRGPLDMRRTIRESLSAGGIPMQTSHHPRRPHRTDLVILCDVSDSVAAFAHFTLLLVYALREQFTRVRVFAFVDDLDEVTDQFRPGIDVVEAIAGLAQTAKVHGWYGRTDYGRAFSAFSERHLDAISPRSSLLVLGDARSNYGDPGSGALRMMTSRARSAFWLNPERRGLWDTGDSAAAELGAIVPMVECRNLAQLGAFVRSLV